MQPHPGPGRPRRWPSTRPAESRSLCARQSFFRGADCATPGGRGPSSRVKTREAWAIAAGGAYYFVKEHFRQQWCSAVCGNRARVARHAQRHRAR
ncbi:CGNR zinc finger domain-containing protein [Mycobacterium simiae]|uniref:CGNR zinc finger domain-containing protein n=1 Tax=Mycobacterium simiae TaxID=1784 RepID=UPI00111C63BC|nr:CGNR zinc finger domain-containing protein [Mycobacterium simiae]